MPPGEPLASRDLRCSQGGQLCTTTGPVTSGHLFLVNYWPELVSQRHILRMWSRTLRQTWFLAPLRVPP